MDYTQSPAMQPQRIILIKYNRYLPNDVGLHLCIHWEIFTSKSFTHLNSLTSNPHLIFVGKRSTNLPNENYVLYINFWNKYSNNLYIMKMCLTITRTYVDSNWFIDASLWLTTHSPQLQDIANDIYHLKVTES